MLRMQILFAFFLFLVNNQLADLDARLELLVGGVLHLFGVVCVRDGLACSGDLVLLKSSVMVGVLYAIRVICHLLWFADLFEGTFDLLKIALASTDCETSKLFGGVIERVGNSGIQVLQGNQMLGQVLYVSFHLMAERRMFHFQKMVGILNAHHMCLFRIFRYQDVFAVAGLVGST